MSDKYTILLYRNPDGSYNKVPIVSLIPEDELNELNRTINETRIKLQKAHRERITMTQEADVRRDAAACNDCNLCLVCAGKHRRYDSWPPGQDECFCNFKKKGKPIKDEPCKLCKNHDLDLRDHKRSRAQGLSLESKLKNILNRLMVQRKELYEKHAIEVEVVSE